jgi:hypothetical protein
MGITPTTADETEPGSAAGSTPTLPSRGSRSFRLADPLTFAADHQAARTYLR